MLGRTHRHHGLSPGSPQDPRESWPLPLEPDLCWSRVHRGASCEVQLFAHPLEWCVVLTRESVGWLLGASVRHQERSNVRTAGL